MNEYQKIAEQKQKRRYQLLLDLWKAADGKEDEWVKLIEIGKQIGFEEEETKDIAHYLDRENLIETVFGYSEASLTHKAIVEIENSLKNPKQSTEHFSANVIQNIFFGTVGANQTGNYNIANVNQNIGQNFTEILEQLALLKREFQSQNFEDKEDAIEIVCDLENEIVKESPNKTKIKSFLKTTKDFAVKTGTELAASTIAKLIESQMGFKG